MVRHRLGIATCVTQSPSTRPPVRPFWDTMPLGAQGAVFAAVIMPFLCWRNGLPAAPHVYNTLPGPKKEQTGFEPLIL